MSTQETGQESQTHQNENLSVTVKKLPNSKVRFEVTVQPKAVEAAYVKALKNINKEVSIPGFRKGKAPEKMIEERFQPAIKNEWTDVVMQTAMNEAIQLTHISPLKDGHIDRPSMKEFSKEKGAKFTIEFEVRPNVPNIEFGELVLKKIQPVAITDKERKNALQRVALQYTTYDPIEGRSIQEGDFVDLDVDLLDETNPRRIIENQRTEVSEDGLPSWIRSKIIGLNAGETAEGQTEQDNENPDPNFKSAPFRVSVNAIWKGNLPEFNDEFAQKVGLQTMEELKSKISERLESETVREANDKQVRQLEDFLIEKYPLDLPNSVVEGYKQARMDDYLQRLSNSNDAEYASDHYSEIEKMIEQNVVRNLKLLFILGKVASENQISVTSEDINRELTNQISLMSSGQSSIDFQGDKNLLREQLYRIAMDHKIRQFLLDKATFVEG